jgi:hypothetical protein
MKIEKLAKVCDSILSIEKAEEYIYSSARDYYYGKRCALIKIEYLL